MNTKQVIVMRKDLNMRKGKMIAQGAHASMKVFFDKLYNPDQESIGGFDAGLRTMKLTEEERMWVNVKFTKVCVSVNSEQELLDIFNKAKEAGLNCSLIQDAGLTEFGGVPTYTCCAIGPNFNEKIDAITKDLPLL
jgi:PTH2 family peptidyl-tRNA hydrolase